MKRAMFLLFGIVAYVFFFATFLYLVAFVGDLPWVPVTVDRGGIVDNVGVAIVVDLLLIALFGIQHSVMARPAFKRAWTQTVPEPIERSIYVVAASLMLILMFTLWRPIPATVWTVTNDMLAMGIWAIFGLGWLIVLLSTFLISHFELFGLKQVWGHARGTPSVIPEFRTPFFYKLVRHPLYSGFIIAFFATGHMTFGHLLLACGMFVYILIAIGHEEHDLVDIFGHRYEDYKGRVGMLAPRFRRARR